MTPLTFSLVTMASLCACAEGIPQATTVNVGTCADTTAWQDALRTLPAGAVLDVDATYSRDTCAGVAQVTGTRLLLRRSIAASSERLNRLLECSRARILVSAYADGLLPDGPVEIEVNGSAGDVAVTLSADSVARNVQLFHRAKALAKSLEK